jgi:PAS domain S-box-containing protein
MQRTDLDPGAVVAPAVLEEALRHAPAAGLVLAPVEARIVAANAAARQLLDIRDGGAERALVCGQQRELQQAAQQSAAEGRTTWFKGPRDLVEVRASAIGAFLLVWLQSPRAAFGQRLRPNLEDALRAAGVGFWERNLDTDEALWDAQCFALFGRDPALGPPSRAELLASVHPEDRAHVARAFEIGAARSAPFGVGYRVVLPNGWIRHIDSRVTRVADSAAGGRRIVGLMFDVTGTREAQQAHRELAARLAALADATGVGVWAIDLASGTVDWNAQMYRLYGRAGDAAPLTLTEALARVHRADRERAQAEVVRAIERGGAFEFEVRATGDDGRPRWLYWRGQREREQPGPRLAGICLDVTALREAAARSEQLAERLQLATAAAGVGIWEVDLARGTVTYDERMRAIYGLAADAPAHDFEQWLACVHPQDQARIAAGAHRLFVEGQPFSYETRIVRADGTERDVLGSAIAIRDESGKVARVLGTHLDVTELRAAERRLRQANEELARVGARLQLATAAAGLGVFEYDMATGAEHWDAGFRAMFGVGDDVPASLDAWLARVHPDDRAAVEAEVKRLLATGAPGQFTYRALRPDGTVRHLAATVSFERDADGTIVRCAGANRDITDEVQAARATAERALLARAEFVARMSHAMRTPLNAIIGFAQLLEMDAREALTDGQRERVGRIRDAGESLLALVGDVMDLARIEVGAAGLAVEVADAAAVIDDAVAQLAPSAAARAIAIERAFPAAAPRVWADRARLKQVLVRVLANAVKYNRYGGRVTIALHSAPGGTVSITVADTGVGMSATQVERLFEPFFRGSMPTVEPEGSGLGLAIAVRLIEQMRGTLQVRSAPGAGTEVRIALREAVVAAPPAEGGPAARAPLAPREDVRGTVLYIEDNPSNSLFVEQLLHTRPNVRLYKAADAATGLILASACKADLILIDMHLPDLDGLELLRRLRAQPETAHVPCVAVSAQALPGEIARARAGGFEHYWIKPLDAAAFLAGVDALLAARGNG